MCSDSRCQEEGAVESSLSNDRLSHRMIKDVPQQGRRLFVCEGYDERCESCDYARCILRALPLMLTHEATC
jgi:hypothetical protein